MMAIATGTGHDAAAGIDESTLTRDRRAAEQPMGVWAIDDEQDTWMVGTGSADYSEYLVDLREGRCSCEDWAYRGDPGSRQISRCKHASRVLQVLGRIDPPIDADVDATLLAQRERWSDE